MDSSMTDGAYNAVLGQSLFRGGGRGSGVGCHRTSGLEGVIRLERTDGRPRMVQRVYLAVVGSSAAGDSGVS